MKWSRALVLVMLAAPALFLAGFVPGTAMASSPTPFFAAEPIAPPAVAADAELDVIDAEAMAEITDITERITPHLFVDDDGLVQLGDVTAGELGVTEEFLADFRTSLQLSNQLIERGEIVVEPDLAVTITDDFGPLVEPIDPGIDPGGSVVNSFGATVAASDGDQPDWGAWHYGSGAMFYNTFPDWMYYRYSYFPLCSAMAAYIRLPWMSPHLVYFYGYNQVYFGHYCYSPYGVYYFIPYGYCNTGLGYKPAYFWSRIYHPGFGYQWGWRGVWCRY